MSVSSLHDMMDLASLDVVDMDHLSAFTDGDRDLETELAGLFLSSAGGYLVGMQDALDEKRSWSAEAHALKGASANLGAKRVASLAKDAEFVPPCPQMLETLRISIQEVEAFFADREP